MITYVDTQNEQKYTVLFNRASAKLGLTPITKTVFNPETAQDETKYFKRIHGNDGWEEVELNPENADDKAFIDGETSKPISNLNEYFQHIHELAELAIGEGRSGTDPYFLRLPLDEPFLEINANTRVITVPSQLRQVGVHGDKYAEIVFFRIDRYYDAVDLATRDIYIEWENAAGEKGVSKEFLCDTQSEKNKDKIIFGWIIDDAITKQAGTIRFAVRFVEWTNPLAENGSGGATLAYSFSSLPAQMTIVESLNYSLLEDDSAITYQPTQENQEKHLTYFNWYLENSDPDSMDETSYETAGDINIIQNLKGIDKPVNLANGSATLAVEASSEDAGIISYLFAHQNEYNGTLNPSDTKKPTLQWVSTDGETAKSIPNRNIYKKENNAYIMVTADEVDDNDSVYIQVASVDVDKPGYYYALIRNTVSGKKANSVYSDIAYVPFAATPVPTENMPAKFIINKASYDLVHDEAVTNSREYRYLSNIKIVQNGDIGPASLSLGGINAPKFTIANGNANDLVYNWYKANSIEDLATAESVSNESVYVANEPGYYAVDVKNSFNNSDATCDRMAAGVLHVMNMPLAPVVESLYTLESTPKDAIEVHQPADGAEVSYQWYRIIAHSPNIDPEATEEDLEVCNGTINFVNGVGTIPFKPKKFGAYYFILTSILNKDDKEGNKVSTYVNGGNEYGVIYLSEEGNIDVLPDEQNQNNTPVEPQVDPDQNPDDDNSGGEIDPESVGD